VCNTYLRFAQKAEELTTLNEIHDHVQILRVLEGSPQSDQERMLDLLQHPPLVVGMLDLLHLDYLSLFQYLDGVETLVVLRLDQMNSSETASTQRPLDDEVGKSVFALCLPHSICDRLLVDLLVLLHRLPILRL